MVSCHVDIATFPTCGSVFIPFPSHYFCHPALPGHYYSQELIQKHQWLKQRGEKKRKCFMSVDDLWAPKKQQLCGSDAGWSEAPAAVPGLRHRQAGTRGSTADKQHNSLQWWASYSLKLAASFISFSVQAFASSSYFVFVYLYLAPYCTVWGFYFQF